MSNIAYNMNFLDFIIPDKFIYTQEQLESMRWEKLKELQLGIYNPGFLIIICAIVWTCPATSKPAGPT